MPDFKVELNVFSLSKGVFIGRWLLPLGHQSEDIWPEVKEAFPALGLDITSALIRLRDENLLFLQFGDELVAKLACASFLEVHNWLIKAAEISIVRGSTIYLLCSVSWQVRRDEIPCLCLCLFVVFGVDMTLLPRSCIPGLICGRYPVPEWTGTLCSRM